MDDAYLIARYGQFVNGAPTLSSLRRDRARHQRMWGWLRLIGPLIIALQLFGLIRSDPKPGLHGTGLSVLLATIALAVGAFGALASRTGSGRRRSAFALLLLAGSIVLARLQPDGPGIIGLFVAVALVARRISSRAGGIVAGVALVLVTVAATAGHERSPLTGIATGIAMASFYAVTQLALHLSRTNQQAEGLLLELEQSRQAQAQAAALAERQRLAREMHDILAHSLSGLLLQLEGARILARDPNADQRLPTAIERAHHLAKAGLDEARDAIHTLRDEALPGPEEISRLIEQFRYDTGIPCTFTVDGAVSSAGAEARLAIYRVTQESLTNVTKHADPESVAVRLAYGPDRAQLTVEDRARPGAGRTGKCGSGYGLTGMRERARLLGGNLHAAATDAGFRVELDVPL